MKACGMVRIVPQVQHSGEIRPPLNWDIFWNRLWLNELKRESSDGEEALRKCRRSKRSQPRRHLQRRHPQLN